MPPKKKKRIIKEDELENLDEILAQLNNTLDQIKVQSARREKLDAEVKVFKEKEKILKDETNSVRNAHGADFEKLQQKKKALVDLMTQHSEVMEAMAMAKVAPVGSDEEEEEDMFFEAKPEGPVWVPTAQQLELDLDRMLAERQEARAMAEFESIENGGEVFVEFPELGESGLKLFYLPASVTFSQLLKDVCQHFDEDVNACYMATKKGLVWCGRAPVLASIQNFDSELQHYEDYEPEDLYIQLMKKPPPPAGLAPPAPPKKKKKTRVTIDREEQERLERLASRERRLQNALKYEAFFHVIFSVAFMMASIMRVSLQDSYEMANAVRASIEDDFPPELGTNQKSFFDVANEEEMFQFLQNPFMEAMGGEWVIGNNNRVVGGFRIMTQRVKPDGCCTVFKEFDQFGMPCYANYESSCADKEVYGEDVIFNNASTRKWNYWESRFLMAGTPGRFASYDGNGFVLDFQQVWDPDTSGALEGLVELENQGFIDDQTRAVIVQMTLYNPNYNMFLLAKLLFEFTPGGLVYPRAYYIPLKVKLYESPEDEVRMVFEITCVSFLLIWTIRFFVELRLTAWETGTYKNTFNSFWAFFEIGMLLLGWATGGLLLWYMIQVADLDLTVDTQYYPDMDGPSAGFQLQGQFMAIGCFLVIMKSFKYMEMSAKLGMINRALARSAGSLATFFAIFLMIYVSFVFMGYQIFGPYVEGYCTVFKSITSLFLSAAGVVDYADLKAASPIFAPLFFFLFVIAIVFIMLNMFVGIVCEGFTLESEDVGDETLGNEIYQAYLGVLNEVKDMFSNRKEEEEMARIAAEMMG